MDSNKIKNIAPYALVFFSTILLVMLATYVYPYFTADADTSTLVFSDAYHQYIDFLSYWQTILLGHNDVYYTFSMALGGSVLPLAAYYLFSPFNLLIALFPLYSATGFFIGAVFIKIGLIGLTCLIYLKYLLRDSQLTRKNIIACTLSITYALSGWVSMYFWNIMWLDALIALPLMLYGIDKITHKRSPALYIIVLALAIISNFYTGFMLCIFSVIWFCFRYLLSLQNINIAEIKRNMHSLIVYIISSLACGGISACILAPMLFSSSVTIGQRVMLENFTPDANFDGIDFLGQLTTNAGYFNVHNKTPDLPYVYIGTVAIVFVILFFVNRRISMREKILAGLVLLMLFASCHLQTFQTIWHLGTINYGLPCRQSFVICFFLVYLALRSIVQYKGYESKKFFACVAAYILIAMIVFRDGATPAKVAALYFDVIIVITSFALIARILSKRQIRSIPAILASLQILCLFVNYVHAFTIISENSGSSESGRIDVLVPVFSTIKEIDDGFYRVESTKHNSSNDSMIFDYAGLTTYSSTISKYASDALEKLGVYCVDNLYCGYGDGGTVGMNSLLGVKYRVDYNNQDLSATGYPYEIMKQVGEYGIYKNPYTLPIVMISGEQILHFSHENPFVDQNRYFKKISGKDFGDIYTKVEDLEILLANLSQDGNIYTKINPKESGKITYKYSSKSEVTYYYAHAPKQKKVNFYKDNIESYDNGYTWDVTKIPGDNQEHELTLSLESADSIELDIPGIVYQENLEVLEEYYNSITKTSPTVTKESSSSLSIDLAAPPDRPLLFTTIPYDENWQATVDGEPAEITRAAENYLAVPVTPGQHRVRLVYRPRGLWLGRGITLATVLLLAAWGGYGIYRRKNQVKS